MRSDEIKAIFDQQASTYDERWARTSPIRDALHYLLDAVFARLPPAAHILCVGAGTGEEIAYLAERHPGWTFTAVEPSGAMLDACRRKAQQRGFAARCRLHEGYVESLSAQDAFDGATCFLVSQFILDPAARTGFFRDIAQRLRPGGVLASSDLSSDMQGPDYEALLRLWMDMLLAAGIPSSGVEQMRTAYARDVAVLPPGAVAAIIAAAGFDDPVLFYQAGLIRAWYATRATATL